MLDSTKIKEFILNPDIHISSMAVKYFDDIQSEDEEILNLVLDRCPSISEVEKIHLLAETLHLKLNLESMNKIIANLSDASEVLRLIYEGILSNASVSLVKASTLDIQTLLPETRITLNQKLQLSTFSTDDLLKELLDLSMKADTKHINEFNYKYGEQIATELASRNDLDENMIIGVLTGAQVNEYAYYECYLLSLAGKRKLKTLIPVFIDGLGKSDAISEESMYALIRLGTADIIDMIVSRYPDGDDDFKIYASGVLENIKTIQSEKAALKLLKEETDITIRTLLAGALCQLYSTEAIPQITKLIEEGYDSTMLNLEEYAYVSCIFNELDIPQMALWKQSFDEEKNFYLSPPELNTPVLSRSKIGRNDPCPCESGKKFKKCCGKES